MREEDGIGEIHIGEIDGVGHDRRGFPRPADMPAPASSAATLAGSGRACADREG